MFTSLYIPNACMLTHPYPHSHILSLTHTQKHPSLETISKGTKTLGFLLSKCAPKTRSGAGPMAARVTLKWNHPRHRSCLSANCNPGVASRL